MIYFHKLYIIIIVKPRDHPLHGTPLLGAGWGARLNVRDAREKWRRSWDNILQDNLAFADRSAQDPPWRFV